MRSGRLDTMALVVSVLCCLVLAAAAPVAGTETDPPPNGSNEVSLLAPPTTAGAAVVQARFELHNLNAIDDASETFEFSGVLTLTWYDPRQAFDPAIAGVREKVFQGNYQVDELTTGWSPQVVLVNESGLYQKSGIVLRIRPDGTSTLSQTLNAAAKSAIDMKRFPFDRHRLEVVFDVLGFDKNEVLLQVEADRARSSVDHVELPHWTVTDITESTRDRMASDAGRLGVSSAFVVSVDVQRSPFYMLRLVVLPLFVIVLLSFAIFWMDRSLIGDRLSISFIGILTGVAYLLVTNDLVPPISYLTLMHGFLNLSFLTMCATVLVNLKVATLEKQGKFELGERLDRRCRLWFPLVYVGLLLAMLGV